eukprot:6183609-Pleurochrysis_carterae.AAC.1
MKWWSGGAQFHSPTLHAFINGLYVNTDKDHVISTADNVHKRVRYQLALSEKLLSKAQHVCPAHSPHHGVSRPFTPLSHHGAGYP